MQMHFIVELKYGYIGRGVIKNKGDAKQFEKIYCDVHRYYRVTKDDIEHKTGKYQQRGFQMTKPNMLPF